MKEILSALCAALCFAGNACADTGRPHISIWKTGNDIYELCPKKHNNSPADDIKSNLAFMYIAGASDSVQIMGGDVCIPGGVIGTQITDIVCRGLLDNPEDRQLPMSSLVYEYLKQAFPCAKKRR